MTAYGDSSSGKMRKRKAGKEQGCKEKPQRKNAISMNMVQDMLKDQRNYADSQMKKERKNTRQSKRLAWQTQE
jgi:hypothetical protein